MTSKSPTGVTPMLFSVMIATCFSMVDGGTHCIVKAKYTIPAKLSLERCSSLIDAMANDALLETGKEGWAKGMCFEQERYSEVVTRSVEYLESKGYKVDFISHNGSSK